LCCCNSCSESSHPSSGSCAGSDASSDLWCSEVAAGTSCAYRADYCATQCASAPNRRLESLKDVWLYILQEPCHCGAVSQGSGKQSHISRFKFTSTGRRLPARPPLPVPLGARFKLVNRGGGVRVGSHGGTASGTGRCQSGLCHTSPSVTFLSRATAPSLYLDTNTIIVYLYLQDA
jgi:hypothetical protein